MLFVLGGGILLFAFTGKIMIKYIQEIYKPEWAYNIIELEEIKQETNPNYNIVYE